ncbi:MAG TPA: YihA family ribosome biogenesis GTP-binding protein [Clostridiaceae bacterium]|nr:YihA family ribosome biogenesis GTP-binding protein [Clostridiaceae bacterium]
MNTNNAKFEVSAVKPEQYPISNLPEVAFVGRSNVGKSSTINTLLNRKNLARVGRTPGKTREINFYNIDNKIFFVDLPGYGYAKVSKSKKSSWGEIIDTYLYTRYQLKLILMLVDIRHTPTDDDKIMYEWIRSCNLPHFIIACKADKISRSQVNGRLQDIKSTLNLDDKIAVIPFSSETRQGRDEVWGRIVKNIEIVG